MNATRITRVESMRQTKQAFAHRVPRFEKYSSLEPENSVFPPITKNSWFSAY